MNFELRPKEIPEEYRKNLPPPCYSIPEIETRERMIEYNQKPEVTINSYQHDLDRVYSLNQAESNYATILNELSDYPFRLLNKGRTSNVFCLKMNNEIYTAKVFDLSLMPDDLKNQIMENELNILRSVQHPNILKYITDFNIKKGNILIIITEFTRWNLHTWASRMDTKIENKVSKLWCFQIIAAINYLHEHGIAHCDLRSNDILLFENGRIKLCDFTHSKYCIDRKNGQIIWQPKATLDMQYLAPELFFNDKADPFKSDCFSMGIIVYIALFKRYPFGRSPFYHFPQYQINVSVERDIFYNRIVRKEFTIPNMHNNVYLTELIKKLLEPNVRKRITAVDAFACPWFIDDDPIILEKYDKLARIH